MINTKNRIGARAFVFIVAVSLSFAANGRGGNGGGGGGGGGGVTPSPTPVPSPVPAPAPAPTPSLAASVEAQLLPAGTRDFVQRQGTVSDGVLSPLALNGDTAAFRMVSVNNTSSAPAKVYLYRRIGVVWNQQQILSPSDPSDAPFYGANVALAGDTLVVGVTNAPGTATPRASYVYHRTQGVWTQEAKLMGADAAAEKAAFGRSIALSGNMIVVGAPSSSNARGAIYVFERQVTARGVTWPQTAKITLSANGIADAFGSIVALSGTTLAAGNIATAPNSALVYERAAGATQWVQRARLSPSDLTINPSPLARETHGTGFGASVAANGNTLLIGGSRDIVGTSNLGSAYVFVRSTTGAWIQQAKLTPQNRPNGDNFGAAVSLNGDLALFAYRGNGATNGQASLFRRVGTTWTEAVVVATPGAIIDPVREKLDEFPNAAAVSGNTLLLSQPSRQTSGRMYVYRVQ